LAHGDCPVAVIRGATADASPPADGPVVVGVDGSSTSDAAIATAFDEASWRGAELVAMHARPERGSDHGHSRSLDEAGGRPGNGGFSGMLLGSTSQALSRYATCPLMVVRPIES
jgi:nucleotide-binding universal stress UspA family protein